MAKDRNKSERERVGKILADKRRKERDIPRRPPLDVARRDACLADPFLFMQTYLPWKFPNPWTDCQREMLKAIIHRAEHGGDKAIAGPRGDGKTSVFEGALIYCVLKGLVDFAVLVTASGPDGSRLMDNIKFALESSDVLCEDFPLVCDPIRALEGAPQRGNMQTLDGERTLIEWSQERIVFPTVAGSPASGAIVMARGIDGSIRGLNVHGKRPSLVLLDDLDTRESAESDYQTAKREMTIERDIAGLGGPGKKIARIMLCTTINRRCLAYKYTDPRQKSAWAGSRFGQVIQWPRDEEAWQEYMQIRKSGQESLTDPDGREATQYYLDRRQQMDDGVKVNNPYRFIAGTLEDGWQLEHSAIQNCYNFISDNNLEAFLAEYQNAPPEESGPVGSGITATLVASRANAYAHATIPHADCKLTLGVDVGNHRLHWVATAWDSNSAGYVIDYDIADVIGTSPEDTEKLSVEQAIIRTLVNLRDKWIQNPYTTEDGEIIEPSLVMIDSGSGVHQPAIYHFCKQIGKPFVAAKGFAAGRGSSPFHLGKQSPTRRIGDHWFTARQESDAGIVLHGFDADHWKKFVHQRFLTPTLDDSGHYRRGGLSLWQSKQSHRHAKYARQIEAEIWVEEFEQGKGMKAYWERNHKDNHYLDATAMACVAASMCGVRIIGETKRRQVRSMAEMQAAARAG